MISTISPSWTRLIWSAWLTAVRKYHYVGWNERIDYILHKAPKEAEIQNLILQKKEETRRFMEAIETTIGRTIDSLFQRADNTEEERLKR